MEACGITRGTRTATIEGSCLSHRPQFRLHEPGTDELVKPNGLCFSPDYKQLYAVAQVKMPLKESIATCQWENTSWEESLLQDADRREWWGSDGIRADEDGNIWASAGWVEMASTGCVFSPEGQLIGQIKLPEICAIFVLVAQRETVCS